MTTQTYKDLQAQIASLQMQAEAARQAEIASAVAEIKAKMQQYGLTVEDLATSRVRKGPKSPVGHFKFLHLWPGQIPPGRTCGL